MTITFRSAPRILISLLLGVLFLVLVFRFWNITETKIFVIDEFTFAHGGWQIARGAVPYRDFYIHSSPLAFYIYGIPFLFSDDNPANISALRIISFIAGIATLFGVWSATSRSRWGIIGAIILLLGRPFIQTGAEIRRDNLAIPVLLLALAIAGEKRIAPVIRGILTGGLFCLTVMINEKALTFGAPFIAAFLVTFFSRPPADRQIIGSPAAFLTAAVSIGIGAFILLTAAGAVPAWFEWNVLFTIKHENVYPGFNWQETFLGFIFQFWWVAALAAVGVMEALRRAQRQPAAADELLLLMLLPASLLSYEMMAAPFIYSLLPFQVILSVFAGRGVIAICNYVRKNSYQSLEVSVAAVLGILLLPVFFIHVAATQTRNLPLDNRRQVEIFKTINRLTAPDDAVFDSSGSAVSRPNVSGFFYTDEAMRILLKDRIVSEVLNGFKTGNCVLFLFDARIAALPAEVRNFVFANFLPYDGDIGVWGHRYKTANSYVEGQFVAPGQGKYFVYPQSALDTGKLQVDGSPVAGQIFELGRGEHKVQYSGSAAEFSIIWLPRDGRVFAPLSRFNPKFSTIL